MLTNKNQLKLFGQFSQLSRKLVNDTRVGHFSQGESFMPLYSQKARQKIDPIGTSRSDEWISLRPPCLERVERAGGETNKTGYQVVGHNGPKGLNLREIA